MDLVKNIAITICFILLVLMIATLDRNDHKLEQRIALMDEIMLTSLDVFYFEDQTPTELHNLLQEKMNSIKQEAKQEAKRIQRRADADRNNSK